MSHVPWVEWPLDDPPAEGAPSEETARQVFGVLGSTRAVRRFRAAPVERRLVRAVLWGATRATTPNNSQLWRFVVVGDSDRAAVAEAVSPFASWIDGLGAPADENDAIRRDQARKLLATLENVPVLIAVCCEDAYPPEQPRASYLWFALGTATQNLCVAARALGLGAVPTMFHVFGEAALRTSLGLSAEMKIGALVALGWPDSPEGPVRRRPLSDVVVWDS